MRGTQPALTGARRAVCRGLCLVLLFTGVSHGVPANPAGLEALQPEGTKITVHLRGDEFYSWHEDAAGYTILKDTATNEWRYAEKNGAGGLTATPYKVGASDPALLNLRRHYTEAVKVARARRLRAARRPSAAYSISGLKAPGAPARTPIMQGIMKNLVILARFSDQATTFTQAQFDSLFNQTAYSFDGAAGSVKDYYKEVSYNKLSLQSTVSQWVTLPNTAAYYGANDGSGADLKPREMIQDAIDALDAAGFDFTSVDANNDGEVDGLAVIHSGRGEEAGGSPNYIWSHMWELPAPVYKDGRKMQLYHTEPELRGSDADPAAISRIGVICHETGHFLGLPDLYDYGGDSAGAGDFCVMAGGSWNGNAGTLPAHFCGPFKAALGWASPAQLTATGSYFLPRIETNDTALYRFRAAAFPPAEYFVMENRQGYGFDAGLPGPNRGVLIWHVDEAVPTNDDQAHYMVDLEEAGGAQHLEQNLNSGADEDYFRFGNNTSFGDTTTPNSKSYLGKTLDMLIDNISATGVTLSFSATRLGTPTLSLGKLKPYPNPCYFERSALTIADIPTDASQVRIYIYTTSGRLVRVLEDGKGIAAGNIATWDGRDASGAASASGLYIFLAKAANYSSVTGKFYVFR